jgi:glycosyltransferase involved in cell wall biosynthesis
MKMSSAIILHLAESLTRLGGVETFVNDWTQADADSFAASLLDSQSMLGNSGKKMGLRPSRFHSLAGIRNHTRGLGLQYGTLICHNFAGLTALSDLITHERLVVCLHTNSPDVWPRVSRLAPFVDGFIAGGKNLADEIKKTLGESPLTIATFESPLDDSFFRAARVKKTGPILVGYSGRLVIEQKRVDRLREFCQALTARGINFRLQITGEGPDKAALAGLLAPFSVEFLGMLKRENLAGTFAAWDFQIITSDYETGPATAMEGMACGVVPVFPAIECQVADILRGKFDRLFYPVGNMQDAAAHLQASAKLPPAEMESLRSRLRELVASKSMTNHLQSMRKILAEIHAKPSRSEKICFQASWKDHLPLAVRCRLSGGSEFLK